MESAVANTKGPRWLRENVFKKSENAPTMLFDALEKCETHSRLEPEDARRTRLPPRHYIAFENSRWTRRRALTM